MKLLELEMSVFTYYTLSTIRDDSELAAVRTGDKVMQIT
jgi:hypothetical protein